MRRNQQLTWLPVISVMLGVMPMVWAGATATQAVTPVTPKGTVTVAFHNFSKEVMDPAQDSGPGLSWPNVR